MSVAQLVIIRGLEPAAFPLQIGQGVIGRAPGSAIELKHPEISRQHCRITWDGQSCFVENISSTRGTTINGTLIAIPMALRPGDEIGVGPVILRFEPAGASLPNAPIAQMAPPPFVQSSPPVPMPVTSGPGMMPPPPPPAPVVASPGANIVVRGVPTDRIELTSSMVIGRDQSCEVVLHDKSVSRRHASVHPRGNGGCLVRDENSQGGSFVNGRRFDEHEFVVGDRLEIGPFCFQFDGVALTRVANTAGGSIRATALLMEVTEWSLVGILSGKGSRKNTILDNVSVHVPPSRFFGLIGPSGAGKSSLLHTLAGLRKPEGGVVLIDGEDIYASDIPPSFGFVPQDDIVHSELTVRQALKYSARLRLAADTPGHEITRLIDQTMDQLLLTPRAELPIWRLSGGQRKRVSVAVELLARPSILFLDEPSSGLDPATEFQLMTLLRNLADTGCTIVCTTHVVENAFLIDQLVILTGGCLAFQGSPDEVKEYFGVKKLTELYDQLANRTPKEWQGAFAEHAAARPPEIAGSSSIVRTNTKVRRAMSLPILIARQWTILQSDWRNFIILLGQPPIIAGLVSWVVTKEVDQPRALVMFFAYLSTLWFGTSNAARVIVEEIPIYRRERLVGVGANSYLLSKFIFLATITCFQAAFLWALMTFFEGGRDGSATLQLLGLCSTAVAAVGIGLAISALSRTVMQAVMIVPVVLIPLIVFAGYVVRPGQMTDAAKRVSMVMPSYQAQAMMDLSFLFHRTWEEVRENGHRASRSNLRHIVSEDQEKVTDDVYEDARPALYALFGHGAWVVVTYFLAWFGLRMRERE